MIQNENLKGAVALSGLPRANSDCSVKDRDCVHRGLILFVIGIIVLTVGAIGLRGRLEGISRFRSISIMAGGSVGIAFGLTMLSIGFFKD